MTRQESKGEFVPFSAMTRMSGIILSDCRIFKGAEDAMQNTFNKKTVSSLNMLLKTV